MESRELFGKYFIQWEDISSFQLEGDTEAISFVLVSVQMHKYKKYLPINILAYFC